jgi:hypothetical protein
MGTLRRISSLACMLMILLAACQNEKSSANTNPSARQYDTWKLADAQDVEPQLTERFLATYPEYDLGTSVDPRFDGGFETFTLSPDGRTVIIQGHMRNTTNSHLDYMFCRYGLDDSALKCGVLFVPQAGYRPQLEQMSWSPDSTKIAMNEDAFNRAYESDLWVLDVATLIFLDMTNDGIAGGWLDEDRTTFQLDYTPEWSPSTSDLYFFRSVWRDEAWTTELWRLPKDSKQPEQVLDLGVDMPSFTVENQAYAAMSPDGKYIAVAPWSNKPPTGIWLIDLAARQTTPLVTSENIQTAWPSWADEERQSQMDGIALMIQQVVWNPNGKDLIVKLFNPQITEKAQTRNVLTINVQDKTITALADYEPFGSNQALANATLNEPYFPVPGVGIIAPDGGSLFYIAAQAKIPEHVVYAAPIPFGDKPVSIGTIQDEELVAAILNDPRASRYIDLHPAAANGRVLIGSVLLTFE